MASKTKVLYYVVRTWPTATERHRNEIGDMIVHGWLVPNSFATLDDALDETKRFVKNNSYQCRCPPAARTAESATRTACPLADQQVEVFQVENGKTCRMDAVPFHTY